MRECHSIPKPDGTPRSFARDAGQQVAPPPALYAPARSIYSERMTRRLALFLLLVTAASACRHRPIAREYRIEGQILAIDPVTRQVTIRHEDIPGLMSGMTMPFKVKDPSVLTGKLPGDLVNGTLMVTPTESYLTRLTTVGAMPLPGLMPSATAAVLEPGQPVPDAAFVDQDGRARDFASFKGKAVVITFIYTRCPLPDYCPLMDRNFATIQRALKANPALEGRVQLLSISFDPQYDTPPVLKAHAAKLGADPAVWTFATGTPKAIDGFAGELGVFLSRTPGDAGLITHTLRTAIVDPQGRLVKIYDGNEWTPDQVLGDLASLAPPR